VINKRQQARITLSSQEWIAGKEVWLGKHPRVCATYFQPLNFPFSHNQPTAISLLLLVPFSKVLLLHFTCHVKIKATESNDSGGWLSMLSLPNFTGGTTALSSPRSLAPPRSRHSVFKKVTVPSRYPCCCSSLRLQELSIQEPLEESREIFRLQTQNDENDPVPRDQEEERGISKIQVSREKYIPVSKAELLDAVLLKLFDSQDDDANQFLLLSS
jgi:hypothetical protein